MRTSKLSTATVIVGVGLALAASAGERPAREKKAHDPAVTAAHVTMTGGANHPTARGTAWVIYDDGTREAWGAGWTPNSGAAGNKFTSTWGTFYCDMMSAFAVWTGAGSSLYFSAWKGTANTGADLTGNSYFSLGGLASDSSGWVQVDGSISPTSFLGNSTYLFSNTAWIGVYVYSGNDVGIDTSGTGGHGFYVDYYSGTGYNEMPWNAMVRARFNGDAVPVELAGFTVE